MVLYFSKHIRGKGFLGSGIVAEVEALTIQHNLGLIFICMFIEIYTRISRCVIAMRPAILVVLDPSSDPKITDFVIHRIPVDVIYLALWP